MSQDLFMQWRNISAAFAAASNTLVEEKITTGLSIRGGYAWLLHVVEIWIEGMKALSADQEIKVGISSVSGETTFPEIDEKGVIMAMSYVNALTTSGEVIIVQPFRWNSLPPTILASASLSLYFKSSTDDAALQNQNVKIRLGYTTIPLDARTYLEIAETFEQP